MKRRVSLLMLSAVMLSALLFLNPNIVQSQPPTVVNGMINQACGTIGGNILMLSPPGICPLINIQVRNTGNCPIEMVVKCAGAEIGRFGAQPRGRAVNNLQGDEIFFICQGIAADGQCRGNYTLRF